MQWRDFLADAPLEGSLTPSGNNPKWSNSRGQAALPVGSGEKNRLGIYDLRGNVSEWCLDLFDEDRPYVKHVLIGSCMFDWTYEELPWKPMHMYIGEIRNPWVGFRCVLVKSDIAYVELLKVYAESLQRE